MRLLRLIIQEWHSFRDVDIDLSQIRVASVIGQLEHKPDKSNGAGKSFLLEAGPLYALFADDRAPGDLQRLGAERDTFVELYFEHRGKQARVKRGFKIRTDKRPGPGFVEFEVDGVPHEGKIREINVAIEEFVGCDVDIYKATSFFTQEGATQFVRTTPAKRKETLAGLLGLQVYEVARVLAEREGKRIAASIEELKRERALVALAADKARGMVAEFEGRDFEEELGEWDTYIEILKQLQADYPVSRMGLDAFEQEIAPALKVRDDAARALVDAEQRQTRAGEAFKAAQERKATRRQQLAAEYQDRMAKVRGIEGLEETIRSVSADIAHKESWLAAHPDRTKPTGERDAAMTDETTARNLIAWAEARIVRNDSLGPVCDKCEQQIPHEHKQATKVDCEQQIQEQIVNREAAIQRRQQAEETIREIEAEDAERHKVNSDLSGLRPRLEIAQRQLAEARAAQEGTAAAVAAAQEEMERFDAEIEQAQAELQAATTAHGVAHGQSEAAEAAHVLAQASIDPEAKRALAALHAAVVERTREAERERGHVADDQRAMLEANERLGDSDRRVNAIDTETADADFQTEVAAWLSKAFSKDGIPMLVMENVVAEIERGTVEILAALESPYRVNFRTQTTTGRDTILIDIETPEGTRGLNSFSGGQVTEINLAVRLALSEVLARRAEVAFHSVFLDEVMAALDAPGRQCFMRVVNLIRRSFQQVFVVSHHPEIRDVLESSIVVVWRPDGSTVEVAR